jgi:periplasmic divalent cation tolerance protein
MDACQVTVACADHDEATRVAEALLDAHVVACVQVAGPIESRYWWQGSKETASEWLCLAKTTAARLDEVVAVVRAHHSYDVPEVLAVPVVGGDPDYLAWLAAETGGGAPAAGTEG